MATTVEALEARVAFLEAWLHIPAVHLPGYVAPVAAEAEPVAEAPAEEAPEELPVEGE